MSNPQETSLAWLAGILDGEGSIGFSVRKRHKTRTGKPKDHILPLVQVSSTSFEIIQRCHDICLAFGVRSNVVENGRKTKANKTVWQWCIAGSKRVGAMLSLVLPHLVLKIPRARAVLSFIESRKRTGLHKTYTNDELDLVLLTREGSSETTREAPIVLQ